MGGTHMHQFFAIREVAGTKTKAAARIAENALLNLQNAPIKRALIRATDVIAFEEIGLLSNEYLNAIDKILQNVRDSKLPFGGVILMSTGDPRQLPPVDGKPVWISTNMFTTFRPYVLWHYVRCAEDDNLKNALRKLQKVSMTPADVEEFLHIIREKVPLTNYLSSFHDAPASAYRVVSKNTVVRAISDEVMERRKKTVDDFNTAPGLAAEDRKVAMTFEARDFVERGQVKSFTEITPSFKAPGVKKTLNHVCEEPERLYVSEGGVYKFTVNDTSSGKFTHGQLCVVKKIRPPGL
jgi:hypothetical protein